MHLLETNILLLPAFWQGGRSPQNYRGSPQLAGGFHRKVHVEEGLRRKDLSSITFTQPQWYPQVEQIFLCMYVYGSSGWYSGSSSKMSRRWMLTAWHENDKSTAMLIESMPLLSRTLEYPPMLAFGFFEKCWLFVGFSVNGAFYSMFLCCALISKKHSRIYVPSHARWTGGWLHPRRYDQLTATLFNLDFGLFTFCPASGK